MTPTPARSPTRKLTGLRAYGRDAAHQLVARHHREAARPPLILKQMPVGVAHAAVENFQLHVVRAHVAALKIPGGQVCCCRLGGVAFRLLHNKNGWVKYGAKVRPPRPPPKRITNFELRKSNYCVPIPAAAPSACRRKAVGEQPQCLRKKWAKYVGSVNRRLSLIAATDQSAWISNALAS